VALPALGVLLLLSTSGEAVAAQEAPPAIRTSLTLRPGLHALWRDDRDGSTDRTHDLRLRFQARALWDAGAHVTVGVRVAGRLSTEQEGLHLYVRDHIPATDGIRMGDVTLDELFVQWSPSPRTRLRLGRFQTLFELAGVPRKSLDRNDSPNTDVTWTDGIAASTELTEGWQGELVLQRNGRQGPTNVLRSPLDVTGSGSRVSIFSGLRSTSPLGALVQREVGLTWIPGAIPGDGDPYITLVGRMAAQFEGAPWGGRLVVGTEGGFAPNTPTRVQLGTGDSGDGAGDGWAFQLSASLMDFAEVHSLGMVFSRAGDAWLLSPDIRENNNEIEIRHYWQYASWGRLDTRFRYRQDMRSRVGALQRREDSDIYLRTTLRF